MRGLDWSPGLWGAVEERGETVPEQCSRKINLAFLGHLKLETHWNRHWVVNDGSGVPKETQPQGREAIIWRLPPPSPGVSRPARRESQPPAHAPSRSQGLGACCSRWNLYLGSEPGVMGGGRLWGEASRSPGLLALESGPGFSSHLHHLSSM